jgi:hypothetical protein
VRGSDAGRELGRLADDQVGAIVVHQREHPRQRGARVEGDEQLPDDVLGAEVAAIEHRRPLGGAVPRLPQRVEGEPRALHHAAGRAGRRDDDLVPGAQGRTGEWNQRPEVPAALTGREDDPHMTSERRSARSYSR